MPVPEPWGQLPAAPLLLTTEEVRLLWSFVHGDIMSAPMRAWLRASLGFCPRHTWAYAVVEIELWESGIGGRAVENSASGSSRGLLVRQGVALS